MEVPASNSANSVGGSSWFGDVAFGSSLKRKTGSIFQLVCRAIRCHFSSRSLSRASSLQMTNHHLLEFLVGLVLYLRLKIKWSAFIPVREQTALDTAEVVVLFNVPHIFLEPATWILSPSLTKTIISIG